jgi:hypothetical protein
MRMIDYTNHDKQNPANPDTDTLSTTIDHTKRHKQKPKNPDAGSGKSNKYELAIAY